MNGVNAFIASNTKGSNTLRPEMTSEFEVGMNLQFFNGRFGIDAAYYNRKTKDQIFTLPTDPSTGFSYMVTNFGEVSNKGIELVINTTPVQIKDFRWDLSFNFSKTTTRYFHYLKAWKAEKFPSITSLPVTMRFICMPKKVSRWGSSILTYLRKLQMESRS